MIGLDFFCGAGGLTRGLIDAGIRVLAGIDSDARCKDTYEKNNHAEFWHADIRDVNKLMIEEQFPLLFVQPDDVLFAGCAPCQPFSQQRNSKVERKDKNILLEFGRIIEECLPGWVLVENVPGMANVRNRNTTPYNEFRQILERNNYVCAPGFVNAKDYGIPQNRRRFVLLASRVEGVSVSLPEKTHGPTNIAYRTVRQAIRHFPPIVAGMTDPSINNHTSTSISPINLERLRATPHDGGDRRSWPDNLVLKCHKDHDGHTDVYGRMHWDQPAPTLTSKCISISNGRYGHPEQDRAISLREAAALQTFPDDYAFYGSIPSVALQIGNAVPVLLGLCLGKHILSLYNR
jgi:DNA (cytosine-5)-methyltransferase 1